MTEVIGTAHCGVVRFFGVGAPDWDSARALGGDGVGGLWLRRGVDELGEVRS